MSDAQKAAGGDALRAMTRARSALVLDHPFFGSLALRLKFKEDPSCRDLWTDGKTLGYNPVYAAALPEAKLIAAQAHEIMHLACGHHVRRKGRDETLWNRACDYAINGILTDAGFNLPEGFIAAAEYAERSADEIYGLLKLLQDDALLGGTADGTGEDSGDDGDGAAPEGGGEERGGNQSDKGAGEDQAGGDNNASASSGKQAASSDTSGENAEAGEKTSFTGEVRDHPGINGLHNDRAAKAAEQEADVALSQAVQRALNMGDLPAGFSRLVNGLLRPSLNWRELLHRFLENCATNDYSWSSPNRRYISQEIYLPSRRDPQIPHIALAVDSSGSVDQPALEAFCAELSSVLDAYDTTLTVLFHDTKVYSSHTVTRADLPLRLVPQGGGGTDYRPVGEFIEETELQPTCLIWFTDLQCTRFPEEPLFPVLWVSSLNTDDKPPFGEVICLAEAA